MTATAPPRPAAVEARPGAEPAPARRRIGLRLALWLGMPAIILLTIVTALSIGPASTDLLRTIAILAAPLREPLGAIGIALPEYGSGAEHLVWSLRLPRVLLAFIVGASLAAAGAVMQSVFRNPLAEPGITGVSSGAACAAVIMIVTGAAGSAPWMLPLVAFLGALAAVLFVQVVAGIRGGGGATLLLVGIALNALLGAVISATMANAPTSEDAQAAIFWLNGDLTAANWQDFGIAVLPIVLGSIALLALIPELNLFLLGEEQAASTGIRIGRTRHLLLGLAALVTAAGVSVSGVISFVGLVAPHLVRLVLGPDHRVLLPVSMGVGGVFLVLADLVARNLFEPVVLQTGTVTAFLGAPVLLLLIMRRKART